MAVPLLDTQVQNAPFQSELEAAAARVLASGRYILGPEVDAFEAATAEMSGVAHGIMVSSGSDALLLALMAMEIGPGDEVICPTFTFFATAGAIARVGATPVFCDILPDTFNLDPASAASLITEKTRAIIPVHLFGQAAEMGAIMELARAHDLRVIEDAAQSLAAQHRGKPVCSFGHCGAISYYPSKNLGGFGDSGMLVTDDGDFAEKARAFRNHGCFERYRHRWVGANFRGDPLQAALLSVKLPHYPDSVAGRQRNAARYLEELSGIEGLTLPTALPHNGHIWNQFTLRVGGEGRRDALRNHLSDKGIGNDVYYPITLDQQECFAPLGQDGDHLEVAHRMAQEVVSIPVFPEMTGEQVDEVVAAVRSF